jgi:hypothetical protein
VEVDLEGGEIGGDLTVDTTGETEISNCRAVQGEVTPASAC